MHPALFTTSFPGKKVQCALCPHNCIIPEGRRGICGVRKNIGGKLFSLVYGKPIAIHIDPIEKKPLYHFYPGSKILSIGTFGCNLSCQFCQNHEMSQAKDIKGFEKIAENAEYAPPEKIVRLCKESNLNFVAFTYNEPTVFYEYMLDTAKLCKKAGIKTAMVSNGQINPLPLKNLLPYLDAFNIDLKSFNQRFYKEICNGDLNATKKCIESIVKAKKHIEVTLLLIEKYNDNEKELRKMCAFLAKLDKRIVLHISRAFPHYKLKLNETPVELIRKFKMIAEEYLENVYAGNI
jgi:pyruvate formate lyase activating enzyme